MTLSFKGTLPSSLSGINKLTIFGYCRKTPYAIFGPPKEGKSIFALQESLYLAKQMEKNILWIDTEGAPVFINIWLDVLKKRFDTDVEVVYKDLRRIEDILAFHGYNVELKVEKTGKIETLFRGFTTPEIEKVIKEKDIGVLVYDSMSNPLKMSYPGGRMNFPARADAIDMWLSAVHSYSLDNDLVSLVVHHHSVDPTNPYAEPRVIGGQTIMYNFKVVLYLTQRKFKPHSSVRDVFLARYYNKKEWAESVPIILTDKGYYDITPDELARMAKGGKGG